MVNNLYSKVISAITQNIILEYGVSFPKLQLLSVFSTHTGRFRTIVAADVSKEST